MQGSQLDRFAAVSALSYYIEVTASLQEGPKAATDERMIVDDEHASCSHVSGIRRPADAGADATRFSGLSGFEFR